MLATGSATASAMSTATLVAMRSVFDDVVTSERAVEKKRARRRGCFLLPSWERVPLRSKGG